MKDVQETMEMKLNEECTWLLFVWNLAWSFWANYCIVGIGSRREVMNTQKIGFGFLHR